MKTGCFIFVINKCVGCMACVVGCSVSKVGNDDKNWRTVSKYNTDNHPDLPVFFCSLACSHCENAPCLKACPSKAYSRDRITGAVIHDESKCLGCKYCTWVCPYDAPKYNNSTCTVEKCNFCTELLKSGGIPACTRACPTGALSFGIDESQPGEITLAGTPNKSVKPRLKVKQSLGKFNKPEIIGNDPIYQPLIDKLKRPKLDKKITALKEWPLLVFSTIMPLLIAWIISSLTHQIEVRPVIFYSLTLFSGVISILHLGKKPRSWRAVLNVKSSWLSREILSYILFLVLAAIYGFTSNAMVGYCLVAVSATFLLSLDFIYLKVRPAKEYIHSSATIMTAILWWSIITGEFQVTLLITLAKAILYAYRSIGHLNEKSTIVIKSIRIILMASAVLLLYLNPSNSLLVFFIFLGSELIDRIEFYNEAQVHTPEMFMNEMINSLITRK